MGYHGYEPGYTTIEWQGRNEAGQWGNDSIWYGEQDQIEWYDPATTNWEELYHEEDFRAIADQLLAEDLGFPTL